MCEKAKRLHFIAKLIGCIGLIACVLGAAAYIILCLPEVGNYPFEWMYLAIVGAVAIVVIVIDVILHSIASGYAKRAADEAPAEAPAEETPAAEEEAPVDEEAALAAEVAELTAPAAEEEAPADGKKLDAGALYDKAYAKLRAHLPEKAQAPADKVAVTVKENAKTIAAVAATCVLAAVTAKVVSDKRHAANRRRFYKWLG